MPAIPNHEHVHYYSMSRRWYKTAGVGALETVAEQWRGRHNVKAIRVAWVARVSGGSDRAETGAAGRHCRHCCQIQRFPSNLEGLEVDFRDNLDDRGQRDF